MSAATAIAAFCFPRSYGPEFSIPVLAQLHEGDAAAWIVHTPDEGKVGVVGCQRPETIAQDLLVAAGAWVAPDLATHVRYRGRPLSSHHSINLRGVGDSAYARLMEPLQAIGDWPFEIQIAILASSGCHLENRIALVERLSAHVKVTLLTAGGAA